MKLTRLMLVLATLVINPVLGFGQTLLPNGQQQFTDANGQPLAGGFVFFYVPNTTTPSPTWKDPTQTTLNSNPVVLDSAGRAIIYGLGQYRQVVEDQFGTITWDNLTQGLPSILFSNLPAFTLLGNPTNASGVPASIPVGSEFNFVSGVLRLVYPFTADSTNTSVTSSFNLTQRKATGPFAYTLPKGSTLFNGFGFWVYNLSPGGTITFNKDAGDSFGGQATSSSAFSLSPGQVAYIGTDAAPAATWFVWITSATPVLVPQGRLTLSTGNPIMTTSVVGATSVLYSPYNGNQVPVWNGAVFTPMSFTETTQALSDTTLSPAASVASTNYDLFGWVHNGSFVVSRGNPWTSLTSRGAGAAVSRVLGIYTNATVITNGPAIGYGVYLGTISTNSTNSVDWIFGATASGGTAASFGVYNYYNRVFLGTLVADTDSYSYNGTLRQSNGSTGNQIGLVSGAAEGLITVTHYATINPGNLATIGVGKDSTTVVTGISGSAGATGVVTTVSSEDVESTPLGFHVFAGIERTFTSAATFSVNGLVLNAWQ